MHVANNLMLLIMDVSTILLSCWLFV